MLALPRVDPKNQDVVMIEDVYIASKSEEYLQTAKRLRAFVEVPQGKFIWPVKEEEFFITIQEDSWNLESVQCTIQSKGKQYLRTGTLYL